MKPIDIYFTDKGWRTVQKRETVEVRRLPSLVSSGSRGLSGSVSRIGPPCVLPHDGRCFGPNTRVIKFFRPDFLPLWHRGLIDLTE